MEWATLTVDTVTAVKDVLEAALPTTRVQALGSLSDGVQDVPIIQVHYQGEGPEPGSATDHTVHAGVMQCDMRLGILAFVRYRSKFSADSVAIAEWVDLYRTVLRANTKTRWGTTGSPSIRSFSSSQLDPIAWEVAGQKTVMGFSATLTLRIF